MLCCSQDSSREYLHLLGLNLEEVAARLSRLLKPAANTRKQPQQLVGSLLDLTLEQPPAAEDQNQLDDFEMIAMTAEETTKSQSRPPTALDSSFK